MVVWEVLKPLKDKMREKKIFTTAPATVDIKKTT